MCCLPCCDFCVYADPCKHDENGCVVDEYVLCHIKNEKVWIGGGCTEHYKCRHCATKED